VCELGACDRLVGVDDWSNWPASVQALPHVGGLDDAQIERIVALRPDVVLLGSTARAAARLQRLGIPVLGLDIKTLADAQRVLDTVGRLLQVPGADRAWQRMEAGIEAAARSVPASAARHQRLLRGQRRALCRQRELAHRRTAGAPGRRQRRARAPRFGAQAQSRVRGARRPQLILIAARDARACRSARAGRASAPCATAASARCRRRRATWSCGPARAWPKPRRCWPTAWQGRLKDKRCA
jgi:hypothetical protein